MSHPRPLAARRFSPAAAAAVLALAGCGGGTTSDGDSTDIASCVLGQPIQLEAVAGNGQSGTAGSALASALQVRLTCFTAPTDNANPTLHVVRNGDIVWTVTSGAGTVDGLASASSVTDKTGTASISWTLGPVAGVQTVEARLMTNLPGVPALRQSFSANAQ